MLLCTFPITRDSTLTVLLQQLHESFSCNLSELGPGQFLQQYRRVKQRLFMVGVVFECLVEVCECLRWFIQFQKHHPELQRKENEKQNKK
jgi:hypothetical protein